MDTQQDAAMTPPQTVDGESLNRLRLSRDAAMHAANMAVRDATRLTRLMTAINDSGELDALLERILLTLSELFAAEIVVLLDPAGTGSYVPLSVVGLPEDLAALPFSVEREDNVARTMREGSPLLIKDAREDETVEAQLRDLDVGSVIYLPVTASHAARGVLILARCRAEPFAFSDVGLLTAMAYRIGLAVEQAQRRTQLERMVRSERSFGIDFEQDAIARRTVETLPGLIGADGASLVLFAEGGARGGRIDHGDLGLDDAAFDALIQRLHADPRLGDFLPVSDTVPAGNADDPQEFAGHALLALPIGRGRLDGVLVALRHLTTPFDPDLHTIAALYAAQCSSMIENARLYRAMQGELADRRRAERALKASEERLGALIRSVHDLIVVLGPLGDIRYGNPAAAQVWKTSMEGGAWDNFWKWICPEDVISLRGTLAALENNPGATRTCSVSVRQRDGRRHEYDMVLTNRLQDPAVNGIVLTFHDVTERKSYELKLEDLAFRDPLTGLANRAFFQDRLRLALSAPDRQGETIAVIFFDLDDFKVVNDSLGHDAGDTILKAVAERMRVILGTRGIGARLGGDEFTILLDKDVSAAEARRIAFGLRDAIRDPISVGGRDVVVGGSFGIALGEVGRVTSEDLLRQADVAMYHAKSGGKNACALFDAKLDVAAIQRLEAETELRDALAHHELDVYFQPIVSMVDGRLLGAEALMRWHHPERGLVAPAGFIDVAEATGLIVDLGLEVVEQSFRRLAEWRQVRGVALPLHINLSPRQLAHDGCAESFIAAARRHGIDPGTISLEITENTLISNPEAAIAMIDRLRDYGFKLAIDDFGTGYSSLSYLKTLPVEVLKIDRSFTQSIASNPRDEAIVRNIISLTDALGITVVAEGVETEDQRTMLVGMGCERGQGYLFSPALPGDEFAALLPLLKPEQATGTARKRQA